MKTPLTKKRDFNKWKERERASEKVSEKVSIVKPKTTKIAYLNPQHKEVKRKRNRMNEEENGMLTNQRAIKMITDVKIIDVP